MSREHRGTICVEDAEVIEHRTYPDEQFVLRLRAPGCAARASAGTFVHVRCAEELPMRRPLSIMRSRADAGWIEVLYKVHGPGLRHLADAAPGDRINLMGPIGNGFRTADLPARPVLIGGGVGIPPLVFVAEQLAASGLAVAPVAFLGSEIPFPFELQEAKVALDGSPPNAAMALTCLEDIGVPSRLATNSGYAGCYAGFVTDLASEWLATLPAEQVADVEILSCGPEPMLEAVARVAHRFGVPSQLCLEEFMACAVGGCAGCTVQITTPDGPAMKRVCVDGPVFPGDAVYPTT